MTDYDNTMLAPDPRLNPPIWVVRVLFTPNAPE